MSPLDKIHYIKGLVYLIGKKHKITEVEKNYYTRLVRVLEFDKDFYDFILNHLLNYLQVINEPPVFSNRKIARLFIKDGMKVAFQDKIFDIYKIEWLHDVMKKNQVPCDWFVKELRFFMKQDKLENNHKFEIEIGA